MEKDPFGILATSRFVVERARYVRLNEEKIDALAALIDKQARRKPILKKEQFGLIDQTDTGAQLVFLEDVVNFCFWPEADKPKWEVKDEYGRKTDGWVALTQCFRRARAAGKPVLDAKYLVNAKDSDWREFFRGEDGVQIPLLKQRIRNLKEAGRVLLKKYDGHFKNVIRAANFDAVKLVELIINDFPSFRDVALYDGRKISFYKRAQIAVYDIYLMFQGENWGKLDNIDVLTVFADYKLPKFLREAQVLEYTRPLAEKVDNLTKLRAGSRQEVEIRAATIAACALISARLNIPAARVDNALWDLTQKETAKSRPYHRARTIFY